MSKEFKISFTEDEIQKLKSLVEVLKTHNGINTFEEVFGILLRLKDTSSLLEKDINTLVEIAGGFLARASFDFENSKGIIAVSYTHLTLPTSDLV